MAGTSDEAEKGASLNTGEVAALISSLTQSGRSPVRTQVDGATLICPQPSRGDLAYLHVVHAGLDEVGLVESEQVYLRPLPPRLRAFYAAMNGLQLFEAALNIDGLVGALFDRESLLHKPFCPSVPVICFPSFHPGWHRLGYFPIGSLVGYERKAVIACSGQDAIVVIKEESGEALRQYANLSAALAMLGAELATYWSSEGALVRPQEELDQIFLSHGLA